jgi:Undecaprenyl-phosphate galactose phosphotransferase WbaP
MPKWSVGRCVLPYHFLTCIADESDTVGELIGERLIMQSALDTKLTHHADVLASAVSPAGKLSGRRVEAWRQRLIVLALIFSDVVLALDVWGLASLFHGSFLGEPSAATVAGIVVGTLSWIGLRALLGLYPGYGLDQVEELRRQTYALLAAGAITAICAVALQVGSQMSRPTLALGFAGLLLLSPLVRQLVKGQMIGAGLWGKPIVLVGSGEPGMRFAQLLDKERGLGLRPVALFDGSRFLTEDGFPGASRDESLTHVTDLARKHGINTIVFAMPNTRQKHLARLVDLASYGFKHVVVISAMDGITNSATVARDFAGTFGVEIKYNLLDPWAQRSKRVLDIGATIIGGALVLLPILILSLLVWMESGRPIFYADKRMGRNGKLFSCVKFRTMVPDAETLLQQVLAKDAEMREEYLKYHKLRHDPRVTRMGRLLRKTSLDELPQLYNVLRGEMSLVGPRPYLPRESADIGASQSEILRVTPGITGPWQVAGRNHATFGERVGMDAYYVRNWSVWLDLVILARTVSSLMLGRRGAC